MLDAGGLRSRPHVRHGQARTNDTTVAARCRSSAVARAGTAAARRRVERLCELCALCGFTSSPLTG